MANVKVLKDAEEIGLAVMLADLIRQNIEDKPEKAREFSKIKGRVLIEARDVEITVGLKFESGKLTVSKDLKEKPHIRIITDSGSILDLSQVKMKFGLPFVFDETGLKVMKKLATRELVIKGMLLHIPLLIRVTRIVSIN
jgi:hypothetical protein